MKTPIILEKKISPEDLWKLFEEYIVYCQNHKQEVASAGKVLKVSKPRIPTVETFSHYAGINDNTLNEWGQTASHGATVARIKNAIFAAKKEALINGDGNWQGLVFDMKANYKIYDTREEDNANLSVTVKYERKKPDSDAE